jgi:hypothetical protein
MFGEALVVLSWRKKQGKVTRERSPLMSSLFLDQNAAASHDTLPQPRGLLPVPPEVQEMVAREEARLAKEHGFAITPEARKRLADSLTLQYFYENCTLAYRHTSQGVEVLAVGDTEIGTLVKTLSEDERLTIKIGQI